METWAALSALLLVVSFAAILDLTREVRSLNKRVIDLENEVIGNRKVVDEVRFSTEA